MSIARERMRLERIFGAALLAACSSSSSSPTGGGVDAAADARSAIDAGSDAPTRTCATTMTSLDAAPDAYDCALKYPCGMPTGVAVVGCGMFYAAADGAPSDPLPCQIAPEEGCAAPGYAPADGAPITVLCDCPGGGRRPAGFRRGLCASGATATGAYLAALAYEERVSIVAFERMSGELEAIGAPRALRDAADRARRDEVRHARVMATLAEARGGRVPTSRACGRRRRRSLTAMAIENAAEGCVRETYGALVATHQALHATDAELARAFATIAEDEARHAALSWALARWLDRHLDVRGRSAVARARRRAFERLHAAVAANAPLPEAGVPDRDRAKALLAALEREVSGRGRKG